MSYSSSVLADSPLLYLRFEETSGATCANSGSLGGNATAHGTFTRNVAGASSETGVGIDLGGTIADFVDYPDNSSLDITADITLECWAKPDVAAVNQSLMTKGWQNVSTAGYEFFLNSTRQLQISRAAISGLSVSSGLFPNDSAWHHVAVTRSGLTYTFYIDGAPAGGTTPGATPIQATTRPFTIGATEKLTVYSSPFNGAIDEVAVYNTALSAARIAAHYAAAAAPAFVPQIAIL